MLATKVSRAVQRVCPSTVAPVVINTTRGHQRRRSSSKASCPPDDSKPTPAAKAVEEPSQPIRRATGKLRRRSDKAVRAKKEEFTLPSVPDVQHLEAKDISFSSFFSLHRPLSLTNPFPTSVTEEAFNAIFDKAEQDPWMNGNSAERRPEDVIYALSQTIESLESEASQDGVVHIDVLTEGAQEGPTRHLDSLPRARIASLEETVAQYQPFKAPPPPQAFTSPLKQDKKRQSRPKTKSYTTTITVTESTINGETSYEASLSPIVQLPDAGEANSSSQTWLPMRKRKVTNMAARDVEAPAPTAHQTTYRSPKRSGTMRAIGIVKRRRLKIKKHKLKKLRRRDRAKQRRQENR